jgi:hypothetical protein
MHGRGLRGPGGISSKGPPVRVILCLLALSALVACAQPAPKPPPANPAGFPFYPGSTLLVARSWEHALSPSERSALGIVSGSDRSAYAGHEVVTATQASFGELVAWLRDLSVKPPPGYRIGLWGSGIDEAREQARAAGIDVSVFDQDARTGTHDVVVIAVDPTLLQRKAGFMLSALTRFKYLPAFLRAPLDAQARAQTGFTFSEALDPTTPIGAAIDAIGRLNDAGARGVIFIDARAAR